MVRGVIADSLVTNAAPVVPTRLRSIGLPLYNSTSVITRCLKRLALCRELIKLTISGSITRPRL